MLKILFGKKINLLFVLALFFVLVTGVFAQVQDQDNKSGSNINTQKAENSTIVNCFDYYRPHSVLVNLQSSLASYNSQDTKKIKFSGYVANQNNQPVVNGEVFARISYYNKEKKDYEIIDEFVALDSITLEAEQKKNIAVFWSLPIGIIGGEYRADFFFSVGGRFNLGKVSSSDNVIVGSSFFTINSNHDSYIAFDKERTVVNDKKYFQSEKINLNIGVGDKIEIKQSLISTYETEKKVDVRYELYYGNAPNKGNEISSKLETITVSPQSSTDISYEIPNIDKGAYYLKIIAKTNEGQSIINIKITNQISALRLGYSALTKFPLNVGGKETIFSCFYSASNVDAVGKVVVVLSDKSDREVKRFEYQGKISRDMLAEKVDFVANKKYNYLKLKAFLYDDKNNLVDHYTAVYDCHVFDTCQKKSGITEQIQTKSLRSMNSIFVILVIALLVVLLILILVFMKPKRDIN